MKIKKFPIYWELKKPGLPRHGIAQSGFPVSLFIEDILIRIRKQLRRRPAAGIFIS